MNVLDNSKTQTDLMLLLKFVERADVRVPLHVVTERAGNTLSHTQRSETAQLQHNGVQMSAAPPMLTDIRFALI